MSRQPIPIPDIDDEILKRQLRPLAEQVLPEPAFARPRQTLPPSVSKSPRKGIELLLPEAVVIEIKTRAAARGLSASVLILELLRDSGYPVVDADFIDLRKAPRR
jgi:hypothetical protein